MHVAENKHTGFTFRGKEIVLQKAAGRPYTGLVQKGMQRGIYPEKKRLEVVGLYAALGQVKRVAELAKVPESQVYKWRKEQWFQDCLREIRTENNEKLDVSFTEIIEEALEQVKDRVRNGDFVQNAKGELLRKPIPAKDLSLVVAINVDKRELLRGEPTSRAAVSDNGVTKTVDRLEKLAETFSNLARFGRKKVETIDAEILEQNALPSPTNPTENTPQQAGEVLNAGQESLNEAESGEKAPNSEAA